MNACPLFFLLRIIVLQSSRPLRKQHASPFGNQSTELHCYLTRAQLRIMLLTMFIIIKYESYFTEGMF